MLVASVSAEIKERRPRVLLADDYPALLKAWRTLLTPLCEVVGEISDGEKVIDAVATLEPDVAIVDLSMLGGKGLDVCRTIKRTSARTHIVIITGAEGSQNLVGALFNAGASAFVDKMSAFDDLPKALLSVLAGKEYVPFALGLRRH